MIITTTSFCELRNLFFLFCLASASAFVISNGHISNTAFFLLFIFSWVCGFRSAKHSVSLTTAALFSAPILAVAIGQLLRWDLSFKEFDAPVRILAALAIYRLTTSCQAQRQQILTILASACGLGLILVTFFLDPQATAFYGGRLSTDKSAPNDLGGYTGFLLVIATLGLLTAHRVKDPALRFGYVVVLIAGVACGSYILLGTQSRGPWLVTALALLLVFCLAAYRQPRKTFTALVLVLATIGVWTQTTSFNGYKNRIYSTLGEPIRWITSNEQETSGGTRLSMLPASKELFMADPLRGFGDFGYSRLARTPEFENKYGAGVSYQMGGEGGPHNEIAARSLQSGIWELIATIFLLLYPIYQFGRQTLEAKEDAQRDLSFMGFVIFSYIFLLSFVLEPYSLKHTATFNALLLAVLLGATATRPSVNESPETTSGEGQKGLDRVRV